MSKAVFENLRALSCERNMLNEKRLYELSELAHLASRDIRAGKISLESPYAFADALSTLKRQEEENTAAPSAYGALLKKTNALSHRWDAAAFSLFLSGETEEIPEAIFSPFSKKAEKRRSARIAYVRSPFAEEAYGKVAELLKDTSVLYVGSAEEACAAVSASEADFALLPVSYGSDARLSAIDKLVLRYRMYIAATVSSSQGEGKEALLALFALRSSPAIVTEKRCLSLAIVANSYNDASELLSVLSLFGFALTECNFTQLEYGRVSVRVTLGGDGDDKALWFFLALSACDFTLLGSYYHI